MTRSPVSLALAWLVTCLAVVAAGIALRLAPVEQFFAWSSPGPWLSGPAFSTPAALVLAVLTVLLLLLTTGTAKQGNRARPFAELLLFYPLLLAFIWFILPWNRPDPRSLIIGAPLALAAIHLARHCPGPIPGPRWSYGFPAKLLDSLLLLLPLGLGLYLGQSADFKALGFSLLLYPLYAFVQLVLFLYIPVTRLRALGLSPEDSSLFAALVFALVHWPNPLVVLVTLVAMLIWARQFQGGRPLWQLALVMGLTATCFSQFLPHDLTGHVRVGPGFVRGEAIAMLSADYSDPHLLEPGPYLEKIYPLILDRKLLPVEKDAWLASLRQARRSTWAYMFFTSQEYRRRMEKTGGPLPPPARLHWTDWPPRWQDRISRLAGQENWVAQGGTSRAYLRSLYQDLLGRSPSAAELEQWGTALSVNQRKRLAEYLLDWRLKKGSQPVRSLSVRDLKLPN